MTPLDNLLIVDTSYGGAGFLHAGLANAERLDRIRYSRKESFMLKQKVSIVHIEEQDTYGALERAIGLIGGLDEAIPSGSKVLVKPNIVMAPTERNVTDPAALEAVLRLVADTSPKEIVIGEGSADSYTWSAFRIYNVYDIATRYGARVVDLNMDEGVRKEVPPETGREYVMLPRTAAEADVVVSVPTFKLWMNELPMSLSLKNLFGFYGARYYGHNKNSHELAKAEPIRTLMGEVGVERGIHHPTVEQSIAAINLARPSDLTVIDALEGSDSKGNYLRMDMFMAGRNAVAVDSVALAVAGFVPEQQEQVHFCSEMGLGPCHLEEIDVLGEPIEKVRFDLTRLNGNVLEMSLAYCLDRLALGELGIIFNGLRMHGFVSERDSPAFGRDEATAQLLGITQRDGFIGRALGCLPDTGRWVLGLIVERGGTSGNYYDILSTYTAKADESNSFWAGLRSLMRLGLAFIFHGQYKPYIVLAEGVVEEARSKDLLPASTGLNA